MMKCRGYHFLLGICVAGVALAADVQRPYVKIARFRGNADCAVSLTFDDAFPSQIEKAIPIFDKHGLRATFFVHTDNVKDTWASSWAAWRAAAATGHEVGSHTKTHVDLSQVRTPRKLRNEIEGSADLIEQHVGIRPLSFAYPFSVSNAEVERMVREVYLLDRSDCRMWGGEGFGADTGIGNIEQAAEKGVWFYCMMHGIDDVSFRPITATALAGIADYLAAHRDTVWTDTYGNVGRYIQERTHTDFKFRDVTTASFELRLSLTDNLPFRERLTMPLTLMVALDGREGTLVKAYRGDEPIPVTVSRDGRYALIDVVPNAEWIQVFWGH
jgi:peptidoglycan/xylan/chitin deacetylase (PgdA/CDA1 family)